MLIRIICYILIILSIDLFILIYKQIKKKSLKFIQAAEKRKGFEDDELTTLEEICSKWVIIFYSLSAIIGGFYVNFLNPQFYESKTFFQLLSTNLQVAFLGMLMFVSFSIIFKYIKNFLSFCKGFKDGLITDNNIEDKNE